MMEQYWRVPLLNGLLAAVNRVSRCSLPAWATRSSPSGWMNGFLMAVTGAIDAAVVIKSLLSMRIPSESVTAPSTVAGIALGFWAP